MNDIASIRIKPITLVPQPSANRTQSLSQNGTPTRTLTLKPISVEPVLVTPISDESTTIRLKPVSKQSPEENVPFDFGTQAKIIRYLCPNCGTRVEVPEDSGEYLVDCPGCGSQLDLTELEPES